MRAPGSILARTRGDGGLLNLTPMIDIVFLLIVFFMLVAQITRQQRVELEPPRTAPDAETRPLDVETVTVQVATDGTLRLGTRRFPDTPEGRARIAQAVATDPAARNAGVALRADRGAAYGRVHPVLRALADAGLPSVRLVSVRHGTTSGGGP